MTRKVIYLTGTRADFGLMQSTLEQAAREPSLQVQVAVTGMHLDQSWGYTVAEVRASGLPVCAEIPVDMLARTRESMASAVGTCLQGVANMLTVERPDVLLLLGDRGEMLAGAIAALHQGVVTVHVHGGERSGTVDEPMRHAISKLSTYHCVATQASRERLVRMGELADHIWVTGAPGLDGLTMLAQSTELACRQQLALPLHGPWGLVLFHPVVQQAQEAFDQTLALCEALNDVGLPVVWLAPNADAGSAGVLQALDAFPLPSGSQRVTHLPRAVFASAMRHAHVMVGNSSAGIIEAATFGTPVVNVGQRQHLRERNRNVMDVDCDCLAIRDCISSALSIGRWPVENVYGDGQAGHRIVDVLTRVSLAPAVLEKANAY